MNLCLFVVAATFMWNTYRQEKCEVVRSFYHVVSAAYAIYVVSLPVICLLAELFAPWVRRKYVERTELSTRFAATALLLLCLRPAQVDKLIAERLKNRAHNELLGVEEGEQTE